jgi:lysozyme
MPTPLVIDLSHHNADPDLARVRASGVVGVIHKATQGTGYVDPAYARRKPLASQASLLWGAYHFGTSDDVGQQVSHFINTVQPDGRFLLVLDFEKNDNDSMSLDQAKQFLAAVEKQTGQRPVLYTGSYFNRCTGNQADPDMARYRVWWAQYNTTPASLNPTWPTYWLWQYSDGRAGPDHKAVDGTAPCDCSAYDGGEARLRATWLA